MRGIRFGAVALVAATSLTAASRADARDVDYNGPLHVTGGVTIGWHGDPARGCAAAGLCGYHGFLSLRPGDSDFELLVNGRGRPIDGAATLDLFNSPPEVRVKRTEPGGDEGGCVDTSPTDLIGVSESRAGGRRVRLGLFTEEPPSTGRCAGPRLPDLLARLPRHTRSVSQLIHGGAVVDFSGSVPYAQGRFSGTVRSNLRLSFGKPQTDVASQDVGPPRRPHRRRRLVRVAHVHALYRVSAFTGTFAAQFAGLAEPGCADFDACGVTGSAAWQVSGSAGTFSFDGYALARRTDHGVRGALAALGRRNAFVIADSHLGRDVGTTSADVSRPGGERCRDTAHVAWSGVVASNEGSRLVFQLGGDEFSPPPPGVLRTGCPGPRDVDVNGFDPAGTGSVPLAALARRSFGVRMRGSGKFRGHGYSGTRSADFALGLERVSIRAVYRRASGI
jgi:hypothetical protein